MFCKFRYVDVMGCTEFFGDGEHDLDLIRFRGELCLVEKRNIHVIQKEKKKKRNKRRKPNIEYYNLGPTMYY